ncbi:alanine transaminase ALT2 NDAI_0J01360 [Naumovozyma dairenensis CBS 421]|uniref:Glutamate pyruvate transaminase n=1 Tax=Naumovozyma dairenensis (strain ATCC 10597 / BCRC 20456 / CBS 421 / NBRC 0211 / NRRL Y-12639) TaxID=1071378 RepID=G0WGV0_NAUDC|nr:hypothetical protein NDAI_0J01360 [Naumovozyma dairenensis CBS 421]CCD27028.1 hypothetical protein NDAI_0J01360 [Naumovozyma dairenensis CBS 421]
MATHTIQTDLHDFEPAPKLSIKDLNPNVIKAEFAVRGTIPMKAQELQTQLNKNPHSLPFNEITVANIGNPQELHQKPLTFARQVVSILQYPELLNRRNELTSTTPPIYNNDSFDRAEKLLNEIGGSVGAYSASQGVYGIRKTIANYITQRDLGESASPNDIFMTTGATAASSYLLSILSNGPQTGVLLPIPQYPLYTALLALHNATMLPYYLEEESGWSIDTNEIEKTIKKNAMTKGIQPKVMVIINPGNPTGSILSEDSLIKIFNIAAKYGIVIIADEVYQENLFNGNKFHSCKKVLRSLQKQFPTQYNNVQLASLHSTSKGLFGECGQRGGYMEIIGFNNDVRNLILKLACIDVCPVVTGQAMMDLMILPPKQGDQSYQLDCIERQQIHNDMLNRAKKLYDMFSHMEGIQCQKPQGAMYLFPRLLLSTKVIDEAKKFEMEPDEFYCHELLNETGICTVPGSGFGQKPNTYHLRTTFLAPGDQWINKWEKFHKAFLKRYT